MNFAHFCEFWCFSLEKQARFTLNFCSGMPLRKVHEPTFLWFGLPGPLLNEIHNYFENNFSLSVMPFGRPVLASKCKYPAFHYPPPPFKPACVATPSACYRGPKPQTCPKWLGEGAKGLLDSGSKVLLHWCKRELHRCKTGFRWCKRLLGDLCSLGPKHLLHPLLTTLSTLEVSGPCSRHSGSQCLCVLLVFRAE